MVVADEAPSLAVVSYDPTREFYVEFNDAFARYWKEKTGDAVTINQSHGGSSKQARSVGPRPPKNTSSTGDSGEKK